MAIEHSATREDDEPIHIRPGLPTCRHCGQHVRYHLEDGICDSCLGPAIQGPASPEKVRRVYFDLARANADEAIKIMGLRPGWWWMGTADDAAWHARLAYQACMRHQLNGGHPEDQGGE